MKPKFDGYAAQYDAWFMENENVFQSEFRLFEKAIGDISGKRVLSVGCGSGLFESMIDCSGIEGIEPSHDMGAIAQKRGINVIAFGAIEEVELEENAYDIIYLNGSSSYMEDLTRAFDVCKKALKPNGKFISLDVPKESAFGFMYLLAKEKEVTLDEAEEAKVVQAAQEYYSSLNDTEIETMGATEEIVENLYREYAMADKVYRLIIQDINPEISDDEARKITVQQIFFATASTDMDGNLKPYSESSIQSAYEKACEVRDLAVDGEHDFTELASKYSDDSEITYSFGKGEAESAYEEAAFNLATDEVSQVVKCERGYYIIKCINTLDREETDANKLKIVEERKREVFGQEYDSFVNTLVRQLNDKLWDEITLIMDEQVTTDNFFDVYAKYFPEE